jgi:hypothetical protein
MPQTLITAKGTHPTLGEFFHLLLPPVEEGVTRVFSLIGDAATIHTIDQLGQYAAQVIDIPLVKEVSNVLELIDKARQPAPQSAPGPLLPA